MKNIPNTIFLNLGEDLEDFEDTWCIDKVGDGDIEYTRKPVWHDLRKNPNDLPKNFDVVIVCIKRVSGRTESFIGYNDGGIWFIEQEETEINVIAWMEIPELKEIK